MNKTCSTCGRVGPKSTMILSRYTGRSWCTDAKVCTERTTTEWRQIQRGYERIKDFELALLGGVDDVIEDTLF